MDIITVSEKQFQLYNAQDFVMNKLEIILNRQELLEQVTGLQKDNFQVMIMMKFIKTLKNTMIKLKVIIKKVYNKEETQKEFSQPLFKKDSVKNKKAKEKYTTNTKKFKKYYTKNSIMKNSMRAYTN